MTRATRWALVAGVLVRRGRIVPVCDVAPLLVGPNPPSRKFYLIATRRFASDPAGTPSAGPASEWTAIPVSGECELSSAEMLPPAGRLPGYVAGLLNLTPAVPGAAAGQEMVEVVDLEKLIATSGKRGPAEVQR